MIAVGVLLLVAVLLRTSQRHPTHAPSEWVQWLIVGLVVGGILVLASGWLLIIGRRAAVKSVKGYMKAAEVGKSIVDEAKADKK